VTHTSITAGLILDDGRTIVASLPQAEAEDDASLMPPFPPSPPNLLNDMGRISTQFAPHFPAPDLSIVRSNGQQSAAKFIGLDAATNLSLLKIDGPRLAPARDADEEKLKVGQRVRFFAPQPANDTELKTSGTMYLRIGETEGELTEIVREPTGKIARLTVQARNLSKGMVGGIVLNDAGETVGLIESSNGIEASLMPAQKMRRAAERVLARKTSVPQPWLGVRGEPVAVAPLTQLVTNGWTQEEATTLRNRGAGILLTAVAPGTPAALAHLRPGDIIVRVNDGEVKSGEEFSWLLDEAGSGAFVRFTVLRRRAINLSPMPPRQLAMPPTLILPTPSSRPLPPKMPPPPISPEAKKSPELITGDEGVLKELNVTVKLSSSLNLESAMERAEAADDFSTDPFASRGLETIPVRLKTAKRSGAGNSSNLGLLVIAVHRESAAARAGLRSGDVIRAVNGVGFPSAKMALPFPSNDSQLALNIIRQGRMLRVNLPPAKSN
jgi:S1-C subfamily serine protease